MGGVESLAPRESGCAVVLDGAKLDGMILEGAKLHQADFLGASLKDARYSPDDVAGALHLP